MISILSGACSPSSSDSEVVDHDLRDNRDGVMHSSLNELMRPSVEQMRGYFFSILETILGRSNI